MARHAASRNPGRPAPVSRALPVNVPDNPFAWRQAGVLDHGSSGAEPAQVAGFGQYRRGADRRESFDRAHQFGQVELVENGDHALLDQGPVRSGRVPIGQDPADPFQGAQTVARHPRHV